MTWSLPAAAATATSLSRAGTGAFMVQVPCACAADVHTDANAPTAAHTNASLAKLRNRTSRGAPHSVRPRGSGGPHLEAFECVTPRSPLSRGRTGGYGWWRSQIFAERIRIVSLPLHSVICGWALTRPLNRRLHTHPFSSRNATCR